MMTPQEVANCTFAKATLGGYNMASVDDTPPFIKKTPR